MNNTTVSIQKDHRRRNSSWQVRWYGEYDPATGKQKRYCKSFKLKVEAEKCQATKTHEFTQGTERDKKPDTKLDTFCKDWLKSRKTELQPATYDLYTMAITRLLEYFGENALLKDITPKNAALFLAAQKNRWKGFEGKDLSDWSREQIKSQCKAIFTTAVDWGSITKNASTKKAYCQTMAHDHNRRILCLDGCCPITQMADLLCIGLYLRGTIWGTLLINMDRYRLCNRQFDYRRPRCNQRYAAVSCKGP